MPLTAKRHNYFTTDNIHDTPKDQSPKQKELYASHDTQFETEVSNISHHSSMPPHAT